MQSPARGSLTVRQHITTIHQSMPATRTSSIAPLYLALAVVGFVVPGTPMLIESVTTGNILFWTDPARTMTELFATRTSTAFGLDAIMAALAACVWFVHESRRIGQRGAWRFIVLTLLFGLGGPLPLFLWFRERTLIAREGTVRA
jgi:uncharacterized protein DUF2834